MEEVGRSSPLLAPDAVFAVQLKNHVEACEVDPWFGPFQVPVKIFELGEVTSVDVPKPAAPFSSIELTLRGKHLANASSITATFTSGQVRLDDEGNPLDDPVHITKTLGSRNATSVGLKLEFTDAGGLPKRLVRAPIHLSNLRGENRSCGDRLPSYPPVAVDDIVITAVPPGYPDKNYVSHIDFPDGNSCATGELCRARVYMMRRV